MFQRQMHSTSQPSSRVDRTDQRRLRSSSGERPPPPNTRRGAAATATIGGGDSGGKRLGSDELWQCRCPHGSHSTTPCPPPVTTTMQDSRWLGRRRRATKWGCVCEMTGGDAGAKLGRARHGPPRVAVVAAVGVEVMVAAMTAETVVSVAIETAVLVGSNDWREWWCLWYSGHLCFIVLRVRCTGNENASERSGDPTCARRGGRGGRRGDGSPRRWRRRNGQRRVAAATE